ncbi:MAG: phosphate ABC transporter permease PstA [Methylococcus sp.]|nr:MAG: phosphate ABC transporter permease PstA [Methylococcus sp.]
MSDSSHQPLSRGHTHDIVMAGLAKRRSAEKRFRLFGLASIVAGLIFLLVLFVSIIGNGYSAFTYANVALDITFDQAVIDPEGHRNPGTLAAADYDTLWKASLEKLFPDVTGRQQKRALNAFMGFSADKRLKDMVIGDPSLIGTTKTVWLPVDDTIDMLIKGKLGKEEELNERHLLDQAWIKTLQDQNRIRSSFNREFFTNGDSREPEAAGIWGAVTGSALTLLITIGLSLPIGIAAAIYLEEFAPRNRWTDLIEVNINNLAAVPSIVFGLLGLAVFINFFGLPRSSPLVGGLVLTLMTLPVIIIAARSALKSVPPSVREAALGIGASPVQMVFDHVLPLAVPGIMTGAIIGTARALGESAPLLMIGMVAFIVDIPKTFTSAATVLPVQIYLWADSPERAFNERTSAAIMVLLAFLMIMNGFAVYVRRRYERRW